MVRGWHGEPGRHGLAAKGIRTVNPLIRKRAIAQLEKIPRHQYMDSLFRHPAKNWYLDFDTAEEDTSRAVDLPRQVRYMDFDELRSNQIISVDYLWELIHLGNADLDIHSENPIVVIRWHGENVIVEGNHRLTAMKMLGRRSARVEFINLDAYPPEY